MGFKLSMTTITICFSMWLTSCNSQLHSGMSPATAQQIAYPAEQKAVQVTIKDPLKQNTNSTGQSRNKANNNSAQMSQEVTITADPSLVTKSDTATTNSASTTKTPSQKQGSGSSSENSNNPFESQSNYIFQRTDKNNQAATSKNSRTNNNGSNGNSTTGSKNPAQSSTANGSASGSQTTTQKNSQSTATASAARSSSNKASGNQKQNTAGSAKPSNSNVNSNAQNSPEKAAAANLSQDEKTNLTFLRTAYDVIQKEARKLGTGCNTFLMRVLELVGVKTNPGFLANNFDQFAEKELKNHIAREFSNYKDLDLYLRSFPERTAFILQWKRSTKHGHVAIVELNNNDYYIYQASLNSQYPNVKKANIKNLAGTKSLPTAIVYTQFL